MPEGPEHASSHGARTGVPYSGGTVGALTTFHHREFPIERLIEAKDGRHVSVCLPARDEERTVGPIVETIVLELTGRDALVDEVLVIDDGSTDRTAAVAAAAGASVLDAAEVLTECGHRPGKGEALWKSLHAAKGDLLVFCDADIRGFPAHFVTGLLGPLLLRSEIGFVKGFYERPLRGAPEQGGRVTELVARPLLSLFFPDLAQIAQPLAGEFAARRDVLEQVPFAQGYGVDLALVVDVWARFGLSAIAQVDLGTRIHRNRPLTELGPEALAVAHAALVRAGVPLAREMLAVLPRQGSDPVSVALGERPPMLDIAAYRRDHRPGGGPRSPSG